MSLIRFSFQNNHEIQVRGNFTIVLKAVSEIVMTPILEAATGAALLKKCS